MYGATRIVVVLSHLKLVTCYINPKPIKLSVLVGNSFVEFVVVFRTSLVPSFVFVVVVS